MPMTPTCRVYGTILELRLSLLHIAGPGFKKVTWRHADYNFKSKAVDDFMSDHSDSLAIFAAGNAGRFGLGSIGTPCTNCLAIGASDSSGSLAEFSARGPTPDGRIKPDIVMMGYDASGANSLETKSCGKTDMSGTSMACPNVAGMTALIRQYLVEGYYPSGQETPADAMHSPSNVLLKASGPTFWSLTHPTWAAQPRTSPPQHPKASCMTQFGNALRILAFCGCSGRQCS